MGATIEDKLNARVDELKELTEKGLHDITAAVAKGRDELAEGLRKEFTEKIAAVEDAIDKAAQPPKPDPSVEKDPRTGLSKRTVGLLGAKILYATGHPDYMRKADAFLQKAEFLGTGGPADADAGTSAQSLVGAAQIDEILGVIPNYGVAFRECRIWPMDGQKAFPPILTSLPAFEFRSAQGGAATEVAPATAVGELDLEYLTCLVPVANEVLERQILEVGSWVSEILLNRWAYAMDYWLFSEDLTGGTPATPSAGLFDHAGVEETALGSGDTTFDKVTAAEVAILPTEVEVNGADDANAKFYFHPSLAYFLATLADAANNRVFGPLSQGVTQVVGRPWVPTYAMYAYPGAASRVFMLYGNLKRVWIGVGRNDTRIRKSEHFKFGENCTTFALFAGQDWVTGGSAGNSWFATYKTAAS